MNHHKVTVIYFEAPSVYLPTTVKNTWKECYITNVPTGIRMEVPFLSNWVLFYFSSTLVTLISVKFNAITKEFPVIFFVGFFKSRNWLLTSTSNMSCGWGRSVEISKSYLGFMMGNIWFSATRIRMFLCQKCISCQEEAVQSLTEPSVSGNYHDISFSYSLDLYDVWTEL
jgi:hypothetical protein